MMNSNNHRKSKRISGVNSRIMLIGIDGATWDLIDPLILQGKMPNFAKLKSTGIYGVLQSLPSLVSPRIWTSIATGKVPEKHGVTGFFATANDVKTATIWDIVDSHHGEVGLLGMMPTWPPRALRGFVVPGWMARDSTTYPENLRFIKELEIDEKNEQNRRIGKYFDYILAAIRHGISFHTLTYGFFTVLYEKLFSPSYIKLAYRKRLIKFYLQKELLRWLLERNNPNLTVVLFDLIDSVSHKYWKYMEPEGFSSISRRDVHKYQDVIPRCYMEVDKAIGEILDRKDKSTTVILVSDHGFEANHSDDSKELKTLAKVDQLIKRLSLPAKVDGFSIGQHFTLCARKQTMESKFSIDEAFEKLNSVSILKKKEQIFRVNRIDPYTLFIKLKRNPSKDDQVIIANNSYKATEILQFAKAGIMSGTHNAEGIILIFGKGVKKGYCLQKANVLDVTPTMLYFLGIPVAEDMDGEVLTEALRPEYLEAFPIQYVSTYGSGKSQDAYGPLPGEDILKKKLRGLGYID